MFSTDPKHSPIPGTVKKINAIPAKTSTCIFAEAGDMPSECPSEQFLGAETPGAGMSPSTEGCKAMWVSPLGPGSHPPHTEGDLCLWKITGMLCHAQQRPHPLLISAGREFKRAAGQRTLGLSAPGKGAEHGGGTDTPLQDELLQALIPCSSLFLGHFTPCRAKYEEFIIPLSS